jgi:hypothetical protein
MKRSILIFCAALALAGCGQNQGGIGGTSDQSTSGGSSTNLAPQGSSQGGVSSPSGSKSSANSSTDTNASSAKP